MNETRKNIAKHWGISRLHNAARATAFSAKVAGVCLALSCALGLSGATAASAQTTTYSNTTASAANGISDTTTPCANPLVRNFTVGTSYTISDVNIGAVVQHTYRGDLQMVLQSPAGTRVTIESAVGANAQNFNVLMDDSAAAAISTHTATPDTAASAASAPPYQRTFKPSSPLSAFNGQNSLGTWRMEICDMAGRDSGTFYRADLYLAQAPTSYADLSLTKSVSNASPTSGAAISYTLTATNAASSPLTATGVQVRDILPAGFSYTGASGTGSYASGTGIWTVGTLAPGASASITLSGTVAASSGTTISNYAEISASSVVDIDSTVNNGSTGEDDNATAAFTVAGTRTAGVAPVLTCPLTTVHDWDTTAWTAGSTTNSYVMTNIGTVGWNITNQGTWLNNATYGGQSPAKQNVVTGGLAGGGQSLFVYPDFATAAQVSVITITLPTAVPAAQLTAYDIDFNAAQFADRITVTGTFNGATVYPTLTNNLANYVIGNSAYGDQLSADTQANGNVVITFSTPVDSIRIEYGNHSLAPADPGGQALAISDITFCNPQANVTFDKSSSVLSDPVNGTTEPKFIPGAVVQYCLLASNAGSATTTGITMTDTLPGNITYIPGSMTVATSCAGAGTAEDDDNAGADESDPHGMAMNGTIVSGSTASIGPSATIAFRFNVTVN
jgi:uncharacterized repeat protein (TIGR01451 family)